MGDVGGDCFRELIKFDCSSLAGQVAYLTSATLSVWVGGMRSEAADTDGPKRLPDTVVFSAYRIKRSNVFWNNLRTSAMKQIRPTTGVTQIDWKTVGGFGANDYYPVPVAVDTITTQTRGRDANGDWKNGLEHRLIYALNMGDDNARAAVTDAITGQGNGGFMLDCNFFQRPAAYCSPTADPSIVYWYQYAFLYDESLVPQAYGAPSGSDEWEMGAFGQGGTIANRPILEIEYVTGTGVPVELSSFEAE